MKKITHFVICYLLLPFFSFSQETALDRVARSMGDTPDSSKMSFSLVEEATDLRLNEQYQEAVLKCNQAIKLNPYNGKAYFGRAFSQVGLGTSQQIIDDCNFALKYGISDPGFLHYLKALNSVRFNSPNQNACNDWVEAALSGNITETDIPKNCGTSHLNPASYTVTFTDDNFENAKITINDKDNIISKYELLINKLDDKALLVVMANCNRAVKVRAGLTKKWFVVV